MTTSRVKSRSRVAWSAALAMFVLAGHGCRTVAREATPQDTLPALAKQVGLTFPPSARLIGVSRERGIDDLTRFKIALSRADLPAFLAGSPVPSEALEPGDGGLLGPDVGFWDPGRARNLRVGQALRANNRALNVGVADADPQTNFVYIVEHGT